MGLATIVSGGTGGSYTIKPVHNRERLDAEITRIEASIDDLEASRLDLQSALQDAEQAVTQARETVDAEIAASTATGDNSALLDATENLARASVFRRQAQSNLDLNTAQLATERLELARLQAVPQDTNQSAWCADFTENLSGQVGTAEIPGEGNTRIIIRPGYLFESSYESLRDGQLFHRAGMSPAQAYFNAAILPGWQKFKPTYRVGTLTAVSAATDTGSVTIDAEVSSAISLGINQSSTLTGVPISYMTCNAEAFEVGDRVLVEFQGQDWSNPVIIGFESNPRECIEEINEYTWSFSVDTLRGMTMDGVTPQYVEAGGSTAPVTAINPPVYLPSLSDADKNRAFEGNFSSFARWTLGAAFTDPTFVINGVNFSTFIKAVCYPEEPLTLPRWVTVVEWTCADGTTPTHVYISSGTYDNVAQDLERNSGEGWVSTGSKTGDSPATSVSVRMKAPFAVELIRYDRAQSILFFNTNGYSSGELWMIRPSLEFNQAEIEAWLGYSLSGDDASRIQGMHDTVIENPDYWYWIHRPRPALESTYTKVAVSGTGTNSDGSCTRVSSIWARVGTW